MGRQSGGQVSLMLQIKSLLCAEGYICAAEVSLSRTLLTTPFYHLCERRAPIRGASTLNQDCVKCQGDLADA